MTAVEPVGRGAVRGWVAMRRRSPAPPPRPWQLAARRFFYTVAIVALVSTVLMVSLLLIQLVQIRRAWRAEPPAPAATAPADGAAPAAEG